MTIKTDRDMKLHYTIKPYCPYFNRPDDSCYCMSQRSLEISISEDYCFKDYKGCDIYKKLLECRERSEAL